MGRGKGSSESSGGSFLAKTATLDLLLRLLEDDVIVAVVGDG